MARPRFDESGPSARERIERAFWEMLSEDDYSNMTVEGLSARAGVNHNTFYYHFKKLEAYALDAAEGEAARHMAFVAVPLFCGRKDASGKADASDPLSPLGKVSSISRNGSRALVSAMLSSAIADWAEGEGIDPGAMGEDEADVLRAVFGGVSCALGSMGASDVSSRAATFAGGRVGAAFASTLEDVVRAQSMA